MADVAGTPGNAELYEILERCDDGELAPLVELLVASPASVLSIARAYELHRPCHARYADRIGDELYRLAIDALSMRDRARPSYGAMMEGLCRKIGITAKAGDVAANERLLFDVFAPRNLGSIPIPDRAAAVDSMGVAISKAADGLFTGIAWPPFAAGMLRIASLRRQHLHSDLSAEVAGAEPDDEQSVREGRLVIRDEDGKPVLALANIAEQSGTNWRKLAPSDRMSEALIPILKSLEPFVAGDRLLAGGSYVRVGIKGGAAALSTSKSGGHLVGSAIGHKGQVPFFAVAAGTVAWPAALLILANTYLEQRRFADIERSLEDIKASLRDVTRFQREERRSILTGSIRYFQQVARAVLSGELDQEVINEIERHEAELVRVQDHLFGDVETQLETMRKLRNDGWGSSKFVKALGEQQAALERLIDEAAMCIRARACGYQLLCAFPGREARKQARFDDVVAALRRLCADGDLGGAMDQVLRERLQGISSLETRSALLGGEGVLLERLDAFRAEASVAMRQARRGPEEASPSITFDVRLEDGRPLAIATA